MATKQVFYLPKGNIIMDTKEKLEELIDGYKLEMAKILIEIDELKIKQRKKFSSKVKDQIRFLYAYRTGIEKVVKSLEVIMQ